jgi:hypothetical protein
MARKILLETHYTFTPSTKTVVIPRYIPRERLLLITNVTTNQVIYNFSDPSLKATSYTAVIDASNNGTTTLVLNYNTTAMTLSDKLQFTIDEFAERILPGEALQDPVQKMRVSTPQSLIDTDFEYGTQPTKWEVLSAVNNKPCQYYDIQDPIAQPSGGARTITSITGTGSSRLVTVVTSSAHGLVVGDKFFIQDTNDPYANGWFMVRSVATTTVSNDTFTYYSRANILTNGSILDATQTFIYKAYDYSSSTIPVSATAGAAFTASGTTVTCTTTNAHGLVPGCMIYVKGTTAATSNPPNGAWEVATTPTANTFTFSVVDTPSGAITALATSLTPRTGSQSIHRAFDGGVKFTTGISAPGSRIVRQTRKYFRYQSGKGIQFSTGSMMKPVFAVDSVTSSSNVVTVTTHYEHFLGVGATILVSGSTDAAYNGTWTIASVPTPLSFTYVASSVPATTPAPGWPINIAPTNWYGAQVRIGMFDDQNGMFFEYDGQNFNAVRRDSTEQLSGEVTTTQGSQTVTGTGTAFSSQLTPGDKIVIRGTTYSVESIASDTSMFIFPEYRGPSITNGGIISKTIDFKVPQSQFNIDRLDGTGPSGMVLNLSKMQMFYIDYAWYGAGAIRFGVKDEFGEVIYVHRMTHANIKTAAYMRSGNLPARYEASNDTPRTVLTATAASSASSISVASTADFPSAGTLFIAAAGASGAIEYVSYTGKTSTTFTGLTRGLTNVVINPNTGATGGASAATTFTYSATAPIPVRLYSRHVATGTSHWGSAVIMDGRFDEDKAYIFQTGMATSLAVPRGSSTNRYGLLSLRVAPSVDNGMVGIFGQRELINRMQLTLKQMDVLAQSTASAAGNPGIFLIEVILNGKVNTTTGNSWVNVGGSSLSQVQYHAANTIITGGEPILSYFVSTVTGEANVVSQDLTTVRELGNAIIAGGTTTVSSTDGSNVFPDGPDMVTITVRNLSGAAVTSASLNGRLSWTEAQA